jgi:hypothetical protein
MTNQTYATVTASPGFWGRLLMKKINPETIEKLIYEISEELTITNNTGHALEDIITLSREYPNETFWIKIFGEDIFENYVYTYQCSNGDAWIVKQGLEYCFGIVTADKKKLPEGLFDQFKNMVTAHYEALDLLHLNNYKLDHLSNNDKKDSGKEEKSVDGELLLIIKLKSKNVCLTATKCGKTYINIDVQFANEPKKKSVSETDFQFVYEDLPFL